MTTTREILSINDACARVGVSRRTLYNWMMAGKVEFVRTPTGNRRIFADSLFRTTDRLPIDPAVLVRPTE